MSRETLQCDDKSWFGITIILFSKCFLFIQIVTLDFEKFISQKPSVPITSVTQTAGPPSHPPQDAIQHLLSTEAYLQEQIKELDAQFDALNVAYQWGKREKERKNERDRERDKDRQTEKDRMKEG